MAQKEKNSLLSFLENLMMHIIKWKEQPEKRSKSWQKTITNNRADIKKIQKIKPCLSDTFVEEHWDDSFKKAKKNAEKEMNKNSETDKLLWQEVFNEKYMLLFIVVMVLIYFIV